MYRPRRGPPTTIVRREGLTQVADAGALRRGGRPGARGQSQGRGRLQARQEGRAQGFLVGQVMKATRRQGESRHGERVSSGRNFRKPEQAKYNVDALAMIRASPGRVEGLRRRARRRSQRSPTSPSAIDQGEFVVAAPAPAAAGKTTLLRLLYRDERPTEGEIEVAGLRCLDSCAAARCRAPPLDRHRVPGRQAPRRAARVYENVAFVLRVLGTPRREITPRAFDALRAVGLSARAQAYPAPALAGRGAAGVAGARHRRRRPPLLIADEPTGNLDEDMAGEILEMIKDIWAARDHGALRDAPGALVAAALAPAHAHARARPPREGRGLSGVFGFLLERGAARPPAGRPGRRSAPSCSSRCRSPRWAASGCCRSTSAGPSPSGASASASSSISSDEPPAAKVNDLLAGCEAHGRRAARALRVARPRRCASLKQLARQEADVADQLPRNPLPASLEVTPDRRGATPEGTRALVQRLAALPEVRGGQGGAEWVERLRPRASASFSSSASASARCSPWPPS